MPLSHERIAARSNLLLDSLPAGDFLYLSSLIKVERQAHRHLLNRRPDAPNEVWFPLNGVIALLVTDDDGRTVQTGVVGPEGCAGLETLFYQKPALADAMVLVAGDMAVISASQLRSAAQARPAIQDALSRFLYELSAQSLQTVACNRLHSLEARCCRWLLMLQDRTGDNDLPLTQECLATMLGSGRPRINGLLASLEQDGLVQRHRGRIQLLTRPGLEQRACECYRVIPYVSHLNPVLLSHR